MIGYLNTLLFFYRRHLRVQPLRELMAVGGVAAGVALLFAVQVSHHSIIGSFKTITRGVAGAATIEVAARGPEGFDAHISETIEALSGVKAAAPILEVPIRVSGANGQRAVTLVGATEQIAPLGGAISRTFQRTAERSHRGLIILTADTARSIGTRLGTEVNILVGERTEHLTLDATVSNTQLGDAAGSPIAGAPLPIVQSLAKLQGRISRVLVEAQPGATTRLLRALSAKYGRSLNVRPVGSDGSLLAQAARPESQVTLLFGAISLVAGMILAFNALLLASGERRRFIGYLIEIGTPDSMIVASLAFDAVLLGVAGCVIGLLAGDALSLLAYRALPGYLAAAFPIGGQRIITSETVLIALGAGMLGAIAAAGVPAIAVLRASASAEPEGVGRALTLTRKLNVPDVLAFSAGAMLAAISIAAALLAPSTTVVALIGLIAGLVACIPLLARSILAVARSVSRRSSDPAVHLAIAELRTAPTRAVALLATGAVAALLMVLIGGSVSNVRLAASRGASDLLSNATIWVKAGGAENVYTTVPFRYQETRQRLLRVAGVSSVLTWRDSFLDLDNRRVWVLGVPPQTPEQIAPSQLIEGSRTLANQRLRRGGWIAVSQPVARERHVRVGEELTLPTPTGNRTFRLAATIANYGWLPGAVVMGADDHARYWSPDAASQLAVNLKPGISIDQGVREVKSALPHHSALTVATSDERRNEVSAVLGSTLTRLNETTIVVLVTTVLSVIALMVAAIWQRRTRLNSLMSIGMSTGQFARLISYESGAVLVTGSLLGAGVGLIGQYLIDGWLRHTTGASVHDDPAWALALQTVAIAGLISLFASLVAIAQTGRFQARAAFSTE